MYRGEELKVNCIGEEKLRSVGKGRSEGREA